MGEVLTNGVYLPDRGERNAYDGLKGNWNTLDSIAGKVPGYDAHISDTDIHVTAADKQTWNGKADASHVHNADDVTTGVFDTARIPNLDASKITTGTIDIDRLPQGALERLVKVADQAARYALTASDVQLGDTVQQLDTGVMYVVTDVTKLDSADGYTEYTAGSATSVPWSGVTGKPADYTPASHSHGNITNDGKVGTAANKPLITGTDGVIQAGSFGTSANTFCEGNDSRLSDARTPVAHTHTKSDVTDLLNSDFIPSANNAYDLGSSSYQWKSVYAQNYYYNGVAWGLDKANTWTNSQTIASSSGKLMIVQDTTYELGQAISSGDNLSGYAISDKNNTAVALIDVADRSYGDTQLRIRISQKFDENSNNRSTSGTTINNEILVGIGPEKQTYVTLNGSLKVGTNNAYDLGTSTKKWKTLNGCNPGALSLPDIANYIDLTSNIPSASLDGTTNIDLSSYITSHGWLAITVPDTNTDDFIFVQVISTLANRYFASGARGLGFISLMMPINRAGDVLVKIKASSVTFCRFYRCLGHVA